MLFSQKLIRQYVVIKIQVVSFPITLVWLNLDPNSTIDSNLIETHTSKTK